MFFPPPKIQRCPYCNQNIKKDIHCQAQDEYDAFGKDISTTEYRNICGNDLRETERKVLLEYGMGPNFEIGCGIFHRTESFYLENDLDFYGIDPLSTLVQKGPHAERTQIGFFPKDFDPTRQKKAMLSHCFGGVLNGAICKGFQDQFWMGLELLGQNSTMIAFDTLIDFPDQDFDFETAPHGTIIEAFGFAPPQYFPSEAELQDRIQRHHFKILKQLDDVLPMAIRRIFVLQHQSQ